MSDPIQDLEHFNEGMDVNPLPASEVRRRGNRLRRRNNALATVGGLAAVAIIAVPLALSASGQDSSAPDVGPATSSPSATPSPDAGPTWRQRIPDGFPLAEGFPATNGSDGSAVTVTSPTDVEVFPPCLGSGDQRTPPARTVDRASVTYVGESEDRREGVLAVYADQDAASAALQQLETDVARCPSQRGQNATYLFDALPSDLGEESFAWTVRVRQGGELSSELTVVQNVRVGNAIYALSYYGAGGANQDVIDFTQRLMTTDSAPTVSSLCVFAAEPCDLPSSSVGPEETAGATGTVDGTGTGSGDAAAIPADFPILDGYPDDASSEGGEYGIESASTDAPPLAFEACGKQAPALTGVERLSAGWTNPEDFRHRQLTRFADVAAADAWIDAVLQVYRDCPTESTSDGYTSVRTVLDGRQGDRSASAITGYELDGSPAPGLDVVTIVRVGPTVLVATTYGEGMAATDQDLADQAASDADAVATLVAAMCRWGDQGC
ncbi:hypothetical protein H5V45_16155 [Nocardioides sp. KIGAM211]|uniref:PknH-like extracellular domain-containing protein n=1 Tax=Nocardioides luti TaxID=2761101 RepID=A0A7X0RIM7_9ACTN|nr:hypothetical protein [Nocardioides luti]MBB6628862.1 hypothetical protein [Nocardioides luti]